MRITASDPNTYVICNNPSDSMVPPLTLDNLGYTSMGWKLNMLSGRDATLLNTADEGPKGYLPSQLTLSTSGAAQALCGDPTNLETLQSTCMRVRPGELYWASCWIKNSTATGVFLLANMYTLTGTLLKTPRIADIGSIDTGSWSYVEGPLAVPETAAYLSFGVQANSGAVLLTDLRIARAS
jgi:hypothetical protein